MAPPSSALTPIGASAPTPTAPRLPTTEPTASPQAETSDAAEILTGLIDQLLEPRAVTTDAVWAFFITDRTATLAGFDEITASEIRAQMLHMWEAENPCYAALEETISELGADRRLPHAEYSHFLDYAHRMVTPCLDEQLLQIDPGDFFALPVAVRSARITRWFDAGWEDDSEHLGRLAPSCHDSFYAYLPDAVAAADPGELAVAWNTALNGQFQCLFAALQEDLRFLIDPAALFELPDDQIPKMIALQTTIAGHALALGFGRDYSECWPHFEERIPAVATAQSSAELSVSQNEALESLAECVVQLPIISRFAEQ